MQSVDFNELIKLEEQFSQALKLWPSIKAEALEEMGQAAKEIVTFHISNSGMKNGGGPVPGWQQYYVGSKNGYVAVRAKGGRDGGGVGKNSAGAITNYTEHGHKNRKPSPVQRNGYRYRPRIDKIAVRGFHFYYMSDGMAQNAALNAGKKLAERAADLVGGNAV